MQLYAKDPNQNLIAASKALKQLDYACIECGEKVRVRSGIHRHPHFFHLKIPFSRCKLQAKGMDHLQNQRYICSLLPQGEAFLEHPFPQIGRIADVAWLPKKLIFEVQCSPISAQEIEQRNQNYRSLGFQVVWILHDKQFNRPRLSAAEQFLLTSPHFFTNIDEDGKGMIYDQFAVIKKGIKAGRLPKFEIDLSVPQKTEKKLVVKLPKMVEERIRNWPLYFSGDLLDRAFAGNPYLENALLLENKINPSQKRKQVWSFFKEGFWMIFGRPYKLIFQLLLERSCR